MKITHKSGFKFEIESRGHKIITDQPLPVGDDEGMDPVELMAAALGGCVSVYAMSYMMQHKIPTEGFEVELDWQGATNPKRIGSYQVKVKIPHELSERQLASISRMVKGCTVHNTLHHGVEAEIEIDSPLALFAQD